MINGSLSELSAREKLDLAEKPARRGKSSFNEDDRALKYARSFQNGPAPSSGREFQTRPPKNAPSFEEFMSYRNRSPPVLFGSTPELLVKFRLFKDSLARLALDSAGNGKLSEGHIQSAKSIDRKVELMVSKVTPDITKVLAFKEKCNTGSNSERQRYSFPASFFKGRPKNRENEKQSTKSKKKIQHWAVMREYASRIINGVKVDEEGNYNSVPLFKSQDQIPELRFKEYRHITSRSVDKSLEQLMASGNHSRRPSGGLQNILGCKNLNRFSIEVDKKDRSPVKPSQLALKNGPECEKNRHVVSDCNSKINCMSEVLAELALIREERSRLTIEKAALESKRKALTMQPEHTSELEFPEATFTGSTTRVANILSTEVCQAANSQPRSPRETSTERDLKLEVARLKGVVKDLEIDNSALRSLVTSTRSELQRAQNKVLKFKKKYAKMKQLNAHVKQTQFMELTRRLDSNDSRSTVKARDAADLSSSRSDKLDKQVESILVEKRIFARETDSKSSSSAHQSTTSLKQSIIVDDGQILAVEASYVIEEDNSRIVSTEMIIDRE